MTTAEKIEVYHDAYDFEEDAGDLPLYWWQVRAKEAERLTSKKAIIRLAEKHYTEDKPEIDSLLEEMEEMKAEIQ